MCQLLGMNCAAPTDITFSFKGFSQRAGITSDHSDGFGIAFFEDKACRLFVDNQSAVVSPIADLVRNYPIKSRNVIAHIHDYGFPPHGGLALGLDRFVMLLAGKDNIREVIAFPKNNKASDPMTQAPSIVAEKQLEELSIKLANKDQ